MTPVSRRQVLAAGTLGALAVGAGGAVTHLGLLGRVAGAAPRPVPSPLPRLTPATGGAVAALPGPLPSGPLPGDPVRRAVYPVALENARVGTPAWDVRGDGYPAVEGYLSTTSAAPGDPVTLHLGRGPDWQGDGRVTVEWYRLGWYGGAGGRLVRTDQIDAVADAPTPTPDPATGIIEAGWGPALQFSIGSDWTSGMYLVVLRPRAGNPGYVPLVVRPAAGSADPAPVLFVSAATTWQAYNAWGGKSLYDSHSAGPVMPWGSHRAAVASFERPYRSDQGAGLLFNWELQFVRWQERRLRDVEYASDVDLQLHPEVLDGRRLILLVGHHEYWSGPMRAAVEAAVAAGTNVAFLGANDMYWQVRLEPSASGDAARRVTCYRLARFDPVAATTPSLATVHWRDPLLGRPEAALIGQMYAHIVKRPADWVVENGGHWIYAGTGLRTGDRLTNLVGQEFDSVGAGATPANVQLIARSPVVPNRPGALPDVHTATVYQAPSGATVLSAGTFQWSWALDSFGGRSYLGVRTPTDKRVEIMTANLLTRLGDGPLVGAEQPPTPGAPSPGRRDATRRPPFW